MLEVLLMEIVLISLLSFSILLLIISFFQKDPVQVLRDEMDQISIQQMQEMYQIKKKIKILEEELLVQDEEMSPAVSHSVIRNNPKREIHEIIKNQVWSLAQQGLSIDQISLQSSLSYEDVRSILLEYGSKGVQYE